MTGMNADMLNNASRGRAITGTSNEFTMPKRTIEKDNDNCGHHSEQKNDPAIAASLDHEN